jgi:predicted tellurium resistance membrane protein TerC
VLAVAAVAKGSMVLLIAGLAISIPLVVFASTFLLKVMDRYPIIVTAGAGLLGYVAGEMVVTDIFTAPWIDANAHWLHTALPAAAAVLVITAGKLLAARARARLGATPLVDIAGDDSAPRGPH